MSDEYEPDEFGDLDLDDVEQLAALSDEDLAAAIEALHDPQPAEDPLAYYATPATRRRKPRATGRRVVDLPPL